MKRLYFIPLALLLVGLTTMAFAAPPGPGQPGPQGFQKHRGFHKFGPRLNLTQEQREKMKEIGARFEADVHDLRYDVRIKKLALEVASSRIRIFGLCASARANEISCFCPVESVEPRSRTSSWNPPGKVRIKSARLTSSAACPRPPMSCKSAPSPA